MTIMEQDVAEVLGGVFLYLNFLKEIYDVFYLKSMCSGVTVY